jgi:hypothetical protein
MGKKYGVKPQEQGVGWKNAIIPKSGSSARREKMRGSPTPGEKRRGSIRINRAQI